MNILTALPAGDPADYFIVAGFFLLLLLLGPLIGPWVTSTWLLAWSDPTAENRRRQAELEADPRRYPAPEGWTLVEDVSTVHNLLLFRTNDADPTASARPASGRFAVGISAIEDGLVVKTDRLRAAARAYYDSAALLMYDAEYDDGIEQLRIAVAEDPSLDSAFADLLDTVAAGQSAGGDVAHPTMMGAMNKPRPLEAVDDLVGKIGRPVFVEPKLDGLAIRAVYASGSELPNSMGCCRTPCGLFAD